jgi:RNA polymerase sigma-70 factor (ECF subfamily)
MSEPVSLDNFTDEELVTLSLSDKDCFGELVDRYTGKLSRYIFRITKATREDVQDILQNVFIKAYTNLNGFDTRLKFSSWIYRITYNEVVSRYRQHRRRPEGYKIDLEDDDMQRFASELSLEAEFDQSVRIEVVRQSIDSLDEKYQQVLVLRYLEDKNYDEIADILKKPPGTVAALIHRAKKKLTDQLNEHRNSL